MKHLDSQAIQSTLSVADPTQLLTELSLNHPVFIRMGKSGSYEYHDYLRDFLSVKLEQKLTKKQRDELHGRFASYFSTHTKWVPAIYHYIKAQEWKEALELIKAQGDELLESEPPKQILEWLDALPLKLSHAHGPLAKLRAEAHVRLGDVDAAIRAYQEFLAQKQVAVVGALETAGYYQELAELHHKKGEVGEALGCVRLGASLLEESRADMDPVQAIHSIEALQQKKGLPEGALQWGRRAISVAQKLGAQASTAVLSRNKKWLALLLAFAVGWGFWQMPPPTPLDEKGVHFLATLVGAVILWILGLFDEYVVALMLLFFWLVFGVVPPQLALAGFSDSSWIFVLGVLGIGAAVTRSGLLYRTALQILRRAPPNYNIYTLILTASGLFATPLLPDDRARVAVMAPMSQAISEIMGFKPRSTGSAGITLSAYVGFSQLSFMFLTGGTTCLMGWNLLPETAKLEFEWYRWTLAALPAGIFTFLFLYAAIQLLFRLKKDKLVTVSPKSLETQLEVLGPLSQSEWLSLAVLAFALIGWVAKPLLGIGEAWVALGALLVFLLAGVLDKTGLRNNIDWGVLLFLGVLFSFAVVTSHLKVDRWLTGLTEPMLSAFSFHPLAFLLASAILLYGVRLFLNKTATTIFSVLILAPWAQNIGIHPGVLLLTILMTVDSWFLPYQTINYQIAYYSTEEKAFSHAQARKLMVAKFLASLLAVTISVPYWRMLGFIH